MNTYITEEEDYEGYADETDAVDVMTCAWENTTQAAEDE